MSSRQAASPERHLRIESAAAMEALGAQLAAAARAPLVVFLEGQLGAGKTTLVRGWLHGLGHEGAVKSPTYTLVEPYELPAGALYHFDLYRLSDPEELEYMGIRDYLVGDAVALIEWPERGAGILPGADLAVAIDYRPDGREVRLRALTPDGQAVLDRLES
ncbi:MAG: tRNA (adenosine(37)-N6)-threonylcarbamoyltransferase complex ATPase subunit type 1 TsaE [Chromatiales bacterium]|nr:tRNA (adenosine(37)-N6)-threonylcarbamoyltransferase complex ATPase subunit type 1 TsaE [Chromatiales bacterium]